MADLRWANLALADLEAIVRHHQAGDPAIGVELVERVVSAATFLTQLPEAGPLTIRGLRKWRVPKTPYLLFYRVAPDHIRVLRVLHGARDLAGRQ